MQFILFIYDSGIFFDLVLIILFLTATALTHLRIPGVLQRFAWTYLVVASIHMFFAKTVDVSMVSLNAILGIFFFNIAFK